MAEPWREDPVPPKIAERIEDLVSDARAARATGNTRLAQALVTAVLAIDPNNQVAADLLVGSATRRQVTLLFCDIVGSTQWADALDPEDVTPLLRAYRAICTDVVDRHGGYIDDHRGDGVLVVFGYPQVQEDDARRAVQCGLSILDALARQLPRLVEAAESSAVRVRIAVHSDLVVLDGVGVAGATANEAARMQELAPENSVVISDATWAIVSKHFRTVSIGEHRLRGVARPVELFRVLGERRATAPGAMVTRFVGRSDELAEVAAFIDRGDRRALVVSGPPGIGKTRLMHEAAARVGRPLIVGNSSRFHRNDGLFAFRAILEQALEIEESDSADIRLAKLRSAAPTAMAVYGDLPFLASALEIPLGLLDPVDIDANLLRYHALNVTADIVDGLGAAGTVVVAIDDVQWADQSSLDLIDLLSARPSPGVPLLLAARDDDSARSWSRKFPTLTLDPLPEISMRRLADNVGDRTLSAEMVDALIARSDGIPLFLEELVRTAQSVGRGQAVHRSIRYGDYQIPPALRDPLLARLSMPQVDLDLAQIAATIGREIDPDLLRRVSGSDSVSFQRGLDGLVHAGLVERSERALRFRHELIREVAYESQKRTTRRLRHSQVADGILGAVTDTTPQILSEVAGHLERALRLPEAIDAHIRLAIIDQTVGSHAEASNRLTHTLDLVDQLESSPERARTELLTRSLRSFSAVSIGGYASPSAASDYQRSSELSEELSGSLEVIPILINSWSYYAMRGDLDQADAVTEVLVRECSLSSDAFPAVATGTGMSDFFRGDFASAARHLQLFVDSAWGHTEDRPPLTWPLPNDPLAAVEAHLALVSWLADDPTRSEELIAAAIARSESLSFPYGPFSLGYSLHFAAMIKTLEGDFIAVAELGAQMGQLGQRHGFGLWQLTSALHLCVSGAHLGQPRAGKQLADALTTARVVLASEVYTPYWLTQLAIARQIVGERPAALQAADEALVVAKRTGSQFFSAEALRARGWVRVLGGDPSGAEDLEAALALSRTQHAPALARRTRSTMETLAVS